MSTLRNSLVEVLKQIESGTAVPSSSAGVIREVLAELDALRERVEHYAPAIGLARVHLQNDRASDAKQVLDRAVETKPKAEAEPQFVVRLYDGFDHLWMDVSKPVSRAEAERILAEKTENGTRNTSYADIDYYSIFPANTRMMLSVENKIG